jgi:hypothetical protein
LAIANIDVPNHSLIFFLPPLNDPGGTEPALAERKGIKTAARTVIFSFFLSFDELFRLYSSLCS